MPKPRRATTPPPRDRHSVRVLALGIFAAALATRLLFWQATADRAWGWTAYFKGDAPLWLEWARAIAAGKPFELGLPIHPPGAAYLAAFFWNELPSGIPFLRLSWIFLGSLVPLLVFLAAERSFGLRVAAVAGCWTAISSGLLVLSTSIDNETPYLVLAVGSIWLVEDLRERPKSGRLLLWSAVNGIACLFRVEHLLFYVLLLGFLAVGWIRRSGLRGVRRAAVSLLFFVLPLTPWHLSSWGAIRRFNEEPRQLNPTEESAVSAVENRLASVPWAPEARRERDRLPAFLRRTASAFVLATVAHRGGREVRAEDFGILDQAFGYRPKPLHRFPFVSSYGPLNFALANNGRATGGFDRSLLADPPPLAGGAASYPAFLVQGLPPGDLTFVYPPHLRLFNDGYSIGARWIAQHPSDFLALAGRKLTTFWSGAASGLTGWNFPTGMSGPRRAVDMVAPDDDALAIGWRVMVLLAALVGIVVARHRVAIVPWLLFLATRLAAAVLFFGYARQGAAAIPVIALLVAFALERWIPSRVARLAIPVLVAGVGLEARRLVLNPEVRLDGAAVFDRDAQSPADHADHRLEVRLR